MPAHRNSQGELITIDPVGAGDFKGQHVLVIHDDPPSRAQAPMLFDRSTRDWLRGVLADWPEDREEAT